MSVVYQNERAYTAQHSQLCADARFLIEKSLDNPNGRADTHPEQERLDAHLAACSDCRTYRRQMFRIMEAMTWIPASTAASSSAANPKSATPNLQPSLADRLVFRLQKHAVSLLIIAVGILVYLMQNQGPGFRLPVVHPQQTQLVSNETFLPHL